jgi:hypothetical protein
VIPDQNRSNPTAEIDFFEPLQGRYLIGEVPETEVAKLVTNLPASCEVPYYFGVRAQGEKRLGDAADWYRVAVECGQRGQAEYPFANGELYRLRGVKGVFSKLH